MERGEESPSKFEMNKQHLAVWRGTIFAVEHVHILHEVRTKNNTVHNWCIFFIPMLSLKPPRAPTNRGSQQHS